MSQVIIWWICAIKRLFVGLFDFFQKGVMSKPISFSYFIENITETWYKVIVVFGSFKIGPKSWFNRQLGS